MTQKGETFSVRQAASDQEWQEVKRFRQQYFFNQLSIQDPYMWTLTHEDHYHFLCSNNSHIIGYAHIQFWPGQRSALRMVVIEEEERYGGMGRQFLKYLEQWLVQQGIGSIHLQSSEQARLFYQKNQYIALPFNDPDGVEESKSHVEMGKILRSCH